MHNLKWNLMLGPYKEIIKSNSKILDVGAGDLYISKLMENEFGKVIGADIMDCGTDFVEKVIIKNNKLPFSDKSFDVVTFNDSLHHIIEQEQILKEALRVGKKIVLFEDAKNFMSYFLDIFLNRFDMTRPFSHKNIKEWFKFFKKLDLEVKYIEVKRPFLYPLKHYIFVVK